MDITGKVIGYGYNETNKRTPIEIGKKIASNVDLNAARKLAEETKGAQAIISSNSREDVNGSSTKYDVYEVESDKLSKNGSIPEIDFVNDLGDSNGARSASDRNFRYYGLQMGDGYASYQVGPTIYKGEFTEGQPFIDLEYKKDGEAPHNIILATNELDTFVRGVNLKSNKIQNYPMYLDVNSPKGDSNYNSGSSGNYIGKNQLDLRNVEFKNYYYSGTSEENKADFSPTAIKIATLTKDNLSTLTKVNSSSSNLEKVKKLSSEMVEFTQKLKDDKKKVESNTDFKYKPYTFRWDLMDELEVPQPTVSNPLPFDEKSIVNGFIKDKSQSTGLSAEQIKSIANYLELNIF